jgi:hypothetical protein
VKAMAGALVSEFNWSGLASLVGDVGELGLVALKPLRALPSP